MWYRASGNRLRETHGKVWRKKGVSPVIISTKSTHESGPLKHTVVRLYIITCADPGGAKGALPPPPPQKIAPPNSQARIQGGGARALPPRGREPCPPYKILDPPMI